MKKSIVCMGIAVALFLSNNAQATKYEFTDTWKNWNNDTSLNYSLRNQDENGTPKVNKLIVNTNNDDTLITSIQIALGSDRRELFDSMFINTNWTSKTNWDDWDYFVHDGGTANISGTKSGTVPGNGLYSVNENYDYTIVGKLSGYILRTDNPNGISAENLTRSTLGYSVAFTENTITYNFTNGLILNGGFFVAYSPWCANDVMGDGILINPVPEPATMLLFGSGLIGFAGIARRRMTR